MKVQFSPQPLKSKPLPFDHPDWIFELKYDGFRSLAIVEHGRCQLLSRTGHLFKSFPELARGIGSILKHSAILDGEIVCLDDQDRPQFRDLLFGRAVPCFFAFDVLSTNGTDLRFLPLVDRKQELRRLFKPSARSHLQYVDPHSRRRLSAVRTRLQSRA
jgi:bifunctional non-homologous end joining protein LigD